MTDRPDLPELPARLHREIVIRATRDTVFRFFTDPERFARWWGEGSSITAEVGGAFIVRYPTGDTASGTVLELEAPERIVLTWGYDAPGKPIPPGGSRVTITLLEDPEGTRLRLVHEVSDEDVRRAHEGGWRYHLAVFAHVATREQHRDAEEVVGRFFAAWNEPDPAARLALLARTMMPTGTFLDPFGMTTGPRELNRHIQAARMHMAHITLERRGELHQCQGTAVAPFAMVSGGEERGVGTNVVDFGPDGRIARVVGIPGGPVASPG